MTVSNEEYRNDYDGNDSTTVFPVDFYFLANAELLVVLTVVATRVETTLILDTDYTVQDAGVPSGGSVTLVVPPATGEKLTIVRNMPLTQLTDYAENDSFPAESHETALDRLTMLVQQLQEEVNRASKTPVGEGGSAANILNSTSENLCAYDGAGNVGPSGKDLDEVAVLDGVNEWSASQTYIESTLSDVADILWDCGLNQVTKVVIGADRALTPSNFKNGGTYILTIIQDGIGGHDITGWDALFEFEEGDDPLLATGPNERTILSFLGHNNKLYGGVYWRED